MSIVVTGAAGFIGSNLVCALNSRGNDDIIAVDNLTNGDKFLNLADTQISNYFDKHDFLYAIKDGKFNGKISAILHQGACSDTMNHDGRYMLENNYRYTLELFEFCQREQIPFLYASSAAVYGGEKSFSEDSSCEKPLNVYGYSKLLFDQILRQKIELGLNAQVAGFRYFNVYGQREQHKGRMASVAFHLFNQYRKNTKVKLFGTWDGWSDGAQSRDFVSVEDVVKVNLFFLDNPKISGIFNLGTGNAQAFNDVASAVINTFREANGESKMPLNMIKDRKIIEYIDFPDDLKGKYQSYTQADISQLRECGYKESFLSVEEGVSRYIKYLLSK